MHNAERELTCTYVSYKPFRITLHPTRITVGSYFRCESPLPVRTIGRYGSLRLTLPTVNNDSSIRGNLGPQKPGCSLHVIRLGDMGPFRARECSYIHRGTEGGITSRSPLLFRSQRPILETIDAALRCNCKHGWSVAARNSPTNRVYGCGSDAREFRNAFWATAACPTGKYLGDSGSTGPWVNNSSNG